MREQRQNEQNGTRSKQTRVTERKAQQWLWVKRIGQGVFFIGQVYREIQVTERPMAKKNHHTRVPFNTQDRRTH